MKNKHTWLKYAVLILAALAAVGYLFLSGMESSMVYYLTMEELSQSPPRPGMKVRVAGWVQKGSIGGSALDGKISFILTDGRRELPVNYAGQVPDTFKDGAQVVVGGIFSGKPVFEAGTVLAKCPSKYESAEPNGWKNTGP